MPISIRNGTYVQQPDTAADPGFGKLFIASAQTNFALGGVVSAIERVGRRAIFDPEPGFNASENLSAADIEEFPGLSLNLLEARSSEEMDQIRADIREERQLRSMLATAPTGKVAAATLAAGIADPLNWIPLSAAFKAYKIGKAGIGARALKGALSTSAIAASEEIITQGILLGTQFEKTPGQAIEEVGAAAFFGAALGGIGGAIPPPARKAIFSAFQEDVKSGRFDEVLAKELPPPRELAKLDDTQIQSLTFQAFARHYPDMTKQFGKDSHLWRGINRLVMGPVGRFYRSESNEARIFGAMAFDTPILRDFNLTEGSPLPVTGLDGRIARARGELLYRVVEDVDDVFARFKADKIAPDLDFEDFDRTVGEALIRGDKIDAAVPGAQYYNEAAQRYRVVMDQIKDEGLRIGTFQPDELNLHNTAESYRPRIWLKEKIKRNPQAFKDEILFPLFERNQLKRSEWEEQADNVIWNLTAPRQVGGNYKLAVRIPSTGKERKLIIDDRLLTNWVDNRASVAVKHVIDERIPELLIKKTLMRPTPEIDELFAKAETLAKVEGGFADKLELIEQIENQRAMREIASVAGREEIASVSNDISRLREQTDVVSAQKSRVRKDLMRARASRSKIPQSSYKRQLREIDKRLQEFRDIEAGRIVDDEIQLARRGMTPQEDLARTLEIGDLLEERDELRRLVMLDEDELAERFQRIEEGRAARIKELESEMTRLREAEKSLAEKIGGLRDTTGRMRQGLKAIDSEYYGRVQMTRQALKEASAAENLREDLLNRAYQMRRTENRYITTGQYTKDKIREEYAELMRGVPDGSKRLLKLQAERDQMLQDVDLGILRMNGLAGLPNDPSNSWFRTSQVVKALTVIPRTGNFALSSMTDIGYTVMVNGLSTMRSFTALATTPFKLLSKEAPQTLARMEMMLEFAGVGKNVGTFEDMFDQDVAGTIFEKGVSALRNRAYKLSLLQYWNGAMKAVAGYATQDRIIRDSVKLSKGTLSESARRNLSLAGIGKRDAGKLAKLVADGVIETDTKSFGKTVGVLHLPRSDQWVDKDLARRFEEAVNLNIRRGGAFVAGQGDLPSMFSSPAWSMFLTFKSFAFAATNRILVSGLQRHDGAVLMGALVAAGLGALRYGINQRIQGREVGDARTIVAEAVDRSGALGMLTEIDTIVDKISGGNMGMRAVIGADPGTRYRNVRALGALAGPVGGTVEQFWDLGKSALDDQPFNQRDLRNVGRILIPASNAFYLNELVSEGLIATGKALELPDPTGVEARERQRGFIQ